VETIEEYGIYASCGSYRLAPLE